MQETYEFKTSTRINRTGELPFWILLRTKTGVSLYENRYHLSRMAELEHSSVEFPCDGISSILGVLIFFPRDFNADFTQWESSWRLLFLEESRVFLRTNQPWKHSVYCLCSVAGSLAATKSSHLILSRVISSCLLWPDRHHTATRRFCADRASSTLLQ